MLNALSELRFASAGLDNTDYEVGAEYITNCINNMQIWDFYRIFLSMI